MYAVPADLERSPGQKRPGSVIFKDTATDIGVLRRGAPAFGIRDPDRQNPDADCRFDPDIDPGIAFLGGCGVSRRALYLASRVAAIRDTAAHDELIAAGVLRTEDYWAYLAAYLGLPFVTGKDALAMSPAARIVPSEALRRADQLMVMDSGARPHRPLPPTPVSAASRRG